MEISGKKCMNDIGLRILHALYFMVTEIFHLLTKLNVDSCYGRPFIKMYIHVFILKYNTGVPSKYILKYCFINHNFLVENIHIFILIATCIQHKNEYRGTK